MADTQFAIGSKEWWTAQADKLIDMGIGTLKYKLEGGITEPGGATNTSNTISTMGSSMTNMLPYILGGFAVVGIVVLMIRR